MPDEGGGTVFTYKAKGLLDQIVGSARSGSSSKLPERVEIQELSKSMRDAVVSTTIEEGSVLVVHLWIRSPEPVNDFPNRKGSI